MDGMSMTLRTDWQDRQLLFPGWRMSTLPSYLATLVVIFVLGVLSEYVNAHHSRLDEYIVKQVVIPNIPSSALGIGEDTTPYPKHTTQTQVEELEAEEKASQELNGPECLVDEAEDPEPFGTAQYWAAAPAPRPSWTFVLLGTRMKLLRTCMQLLRSFIAFLLMVTLMTLDVGFVLMVLAGSAAGFFFFRASVLRPKRRDSELEHHQ